MAADGGMEGRRERGTGGGGTGREHVYGGSGGRKRDRNDRERRGGQDGFANTKCFGETFRAVSPVTRSRSAHLRRYLRGCGFELASQDDEVVDAMPPRTK
ncbi:hypothetical protein RRG08_001131 [Elysia crispata]|uniref:Uncharacterized protein n=1 Tax=Elysia crispata TaxID=231223 RepID=A0AAE0Z7I5_9GAST|nr:hypothetical protein RRG08_001131 [Elysia crispata]